MTPKKILLLYKSSAYEYYKSVSSLKSIRPAELKRFQEAHKAHYLSLAKVEDALKGKSLIYEKVMRGTIRDYANFDMVIAVGGDGTFLEAARYIRDQVILGVNSDPSWSVGRLCSVTADEFEDILLDILSGKRQAISLNRLAFRIKALKHEQYFLNDILVSHANPASLSRYVLGIGNINEEQRGSGIWISTAVGSTGAISSAGGVVLPMESRAIQYMPRELYRGWRDEGYQFQGGVLPPETLITLTSLMGDGMIFVDGSHQRIPFSISQEIEIYQSKHCLRTF